MRSPAAVMHWGLHSLGRCIGALCCVVAAEPKAWTVARICAPVAWRIDPGTQALQRAMSFMALRHGFDGACGSGASGYLWLTLTCAAVPAAPSDAFVDFADFDGGQSLLHRN